MWQILSSFLRCIVYNRGKTEAIYQIQRLWKLMPICDTSHVSFCQNCECIFVYSVIVCCSSTTHYNLRQSHYLILCNDRMFMFTIVYCRAWIFRNFDQHHQRVFASHPPFLTILNSWYAWAHIIHEVNQCIFRFIAENCIGLKEVYKEF